MKKFLFIPLLALLAVTSCKKNDNTVSTLVTYSTPTVVVTGGQYYYSIPVGGSLPNIQATAYDTFYKQSYVPVIDQSTLDNSTPGLYIVYITAKNIYGMVGSTAVYVAVTNVSSSINLSGMYARTSNNDTVHVTKLATGLYRTDNVGGVLSNNPTFILPAFFVQTSNNMISLPLQQTSQGTLYGTSDSLNMTVADTFYQYIITGNSNFGGSLRVFQKL